MNDGIPGAGTPPREFSVKTLLIIAACVAAGVPMSAKAMPNPASAFCIAMDGRSVFARLPDGGDVGLCYLPNRKIVEEWTLFRMLDGRVPTPDNNPFR